MFYIRVELYGTLTSVLIDVKRRETFAVFLLNRKPEAARERRTFNIIINHGRVHERCVYEAACTLTPEARETGNARTRTHARTRRLSRAHLALRCVS